MLTVYHLGNLGNPVYNTPYSVSPRLQIAGWPVGSQIHRLCVNTSMQEVFLNVSS